MRRSYSFVVQVHAVFLVPENSHFHSIINRRVEINPTFWQMRLQHGKQLNEIKWNRSDQTFYWLSTLSHSKQIFTLFCSLSKEHFTVDSLKISLRKHLKAIKKRTKWNNKRPNDWHSKWEGEIAASQFTYDVVDLCAGRKHLGRPNSLIRFTRKLICIQIIINYYGPRPWRCLWPFSAASVQCSHCVKHLRFIHLTQTWSALCWNLLIYAHTANVIVQCSTHWKTNNGHCCIVKWLPLSFECKTVFAVLLVILKGSSQV